MMDMNRQTISAGPATCNICGNRVWTRHGPVLTWHTRVGQHDFFVMPTYLSGGGYWLLTADKPGYGLDGIPANSGSALPFPNWHAVEREVDRVLAAVATA